MKTTNSPLPSLTEKEKTVLEFVEQSVMEQGISPSYQEIKDHFGFASFNSVQNYLKQLANKGYIEIPSHQKRAIQILHSSQTVQKFVQKLTKTKQAFSKVESSINELLSVPLLGKVAAGLPLEAFTHDETIDVPPDLVRNASKTYALRVSGNSMIDDGIHDGDVILVQKQQTATNGEIVVASVENESTVKRFFMRPDPDGSGEKKVELRPANSTMKSMWFSPNQIEIQGILVGLIRKF